MDVLVLSADDLARALPMQAAVAAMKDAFRALSAGEVDAPQRVPLRSETGVTLLMGASVRQGGLAAKIVSIFPTNRERGAPVVQGLVLVLDPESGAPLALCDGSALTALRTGAASGAATDLLARADARVALVIGCGVQARTQLLAIDAVRRLERVHVVGRRPENVAAFLREMGPSVRAELSADLPVEEAVPLADIVCLATDSAVPVLRGDLLAPGTHINGVGSFTLEMQEADEEAVGRARVFVDSLEGAQAEAGDLVLAERAGRTRRSEWTELGAALEGRAAGRGSADEITFFKSVGHAVQDVVAATRALERARELGLGTIVAL